MELILHWVSHANSNPQKHFNKITAFPENFGPLDFSTLALYSLLQNMLAFVCVYIKQDDL